MCELKPKIKSRNVLDFLNNVENKRRKEDSSILLDLMIKVTSEVVKMRENSIVGFGLY